MLYTCRALIRSALLKDMNKDIKPTESIVMPSEEARKMFGVSKRTWAIWREKKLLRYVKIGQLIFYKVDDINEFINNHYVKF